MIPSDARDLKLTLGPVAGRIVRVAGAVGLLGLAASAVLGLTGGADPARFFHAYLIAFLYFLTLSLGGLCFILLQHVTGATWSVVVRRLAEGVAGNLPLLALFFIPLIFGLKDLYPWAVGERVAGDPVLQSKTPYLNPTFFLIRTAIYFAIWSLIVWFFNSRSLAQDRRPEVATTLTMERVSAPSIILFAVTVTFAGFDYLMSLEPHWFSTIFGVYFFSGAMVGFFALLPLLVYFLQRGGRLRSIITREHFHDMGKWMFAFIIFWAYIGFSQYMLIWYANLPEETFWYRARQEPGWVVVSLVLLFGHFLIPFFGLLPRWVKKAPAVLAFWSVWMLVMHWFDLYWLGMPQFSPGRLPFHWLDLTCWIGIGGIFVATTAYRLRDRALIPEGDPRLNDSLVFENI